MPNIPIRPKGKKYQLKAEEMNCLVWHTISGCKKEEAYRLFVRPDLVTSPMVLGKTARQFFDMIEARNFLADYTRTLEGEDTTPGAKEEPKTREERKAEAVEEFTDKVVEKMCGEFTNVEEMSKVAQLADRVGVLAEKEESVEQPRRYLPERCSECRYKVFVEENVKLGNIVDDGAD